MGLKSFVRGLLQHVALLVAPPKKALGGPTDSEAACEVVRITSLEPHGNADKLEVAHFEMATGPSGYEVVVQKGTHRVGDFVVYLSVDCVVPIAGPFAFLGQRLDGKGKTEFRLRSARLRGRYSQGLLLALSDVPDKDRAAVLGTQLWDALGVTYYRAPEPGQPSQPSTKKPRPQPIPVYGVESLMKAPNLFADQAQVVITEKIHGTNYRFGWVRRKLLGFIPCGWKFVVGSHRCIKEGEEAGREGWYGEDFYTEYAAQNDLAERTRGHRGHVFYGELYGYTYGGKKIQDLTYPCSVYPVYPFVVEQDTGPRLAVFDVLTPDGWLGHADRLALCQRLDLSHVPVLPVSGSGPYTLRDFQEFAEGYSVLSPSQIREGIVVETPTGGKHRRKAKFVSESYHLRDGGKHKPNPKKYSVSADAPRKMEVLTKSYVMKHAPGCLDQPRTPRGCDCGADHQ